MRPILTTAMFEIYGIEELQQTSIERATSHTSENVKSHFLVGPHSSDDHQGSDRLLTLLLIADFDALGQ